MLNRLIKRIIAYLVKKFYPELLNCTHVINPSIYEKLSDKQYQRVLAIFNEGRPI